MWPVRSNLFNKPLSVIANLAIAGFLLMTGPFTQGQGMPAAPLPFANCMPHLVSLMRDSEILVYRDVVASVTGDASQPGGRVAQVDPKLLIPTRPEEAARVLRAEVNHIYQPLRELLGTNADARQRFQRLYDERMRLLAMNQDDPAYASAARDNNALWKGLGEYIQQQGNHWRNALRRARNEPLHRSLRGSSAELAWMRKWGHLDEWNTLMDAWAAAKEADGDATKLLALTVPPPLVIQPPRPPQVSVEGAWYVGKDAYYLGAGGSLRLPEGRGWPQEGAATWSKSGDRVTFRWRVRSRAFHDLWNEESFIGDLRGESLVGVRTTIWHGGPGGTKTTTFPLTLTRRQP